MPSLQASSTGPLEVTDDLIYNLAADVETVDHLDALGIALGFDQAARTRFHSTNNLSGSVGCRGTRDMLTEWRQRTPGADKAKLKRALQQARLIKLAEKYLPGQSIQQFFIKRYDNNSGFLYHAHVLALLALHNYYHGFIMAAILAL